MSEDAKTYEGQCFCGAVRIVVTGDAVGAGYCHCAACRSWSAGPVNAFTLWKPDAVQVTQGEDKIDLSGIDANPMVAGDQAFTFIADPAHYTGSWVGVVWETTANGISTINVSIDATPGSEMQINVNHTHNFTAADFIL